MVERTVSFKLDLQPGVAQLKQQLASVEQLSKQSMLSIQHAEERHVQKMSELRKRLSQIDNDVNVSNVASHRKAIQAIEQEETRHTLRLTQMRERGQLAQMGGQAAGGRGGLSMLGHIAQAAGFYRTGHLIRASSQFGIGSQMAGGAGAMAEGAGAAAGEAAGLGALAAAALPAAVALGAVMVASKLVEVGFNAVAQTAQSIVGAISTIGGARGLQEMLVESAGTERLAANISANLTEKLSTRQVMDRMTAMSERSEFKPQEIGALFNAFKAKTGDISTLTNLGMFGPNLATVSGMSTTETGTLLGQLSAQFGLQGSQLRDAALMLWQQGKAGTVELKDATSISQALGFSRAAGGGNILKGIASEMGAVQLAQKGLGGGSADEAVTSVRRMQEDLQRKPGEIQAAIGGGAIMGKDNQGNFTFRNFSDTLARLSLAEIQGRLPQKLLDERAMRVPRGIGEFAAQQPEFMAAGTNAQKIQVIEDIIQKFSDSKVVLDEFDGALKKNTDTVEYQYKEAFNKVSVELEGAFLPVLRELVPVIKSFADRITEHKDEIGDAFRKFVTTMIMVAELLPTIFTGVLSFVQSILPDVDENVQRIKADIKSKEENKAFTEAHPSFFSKDAPANWQKMIDADKKELAMYEGMQKVKDINLEEQKKTAADKARGILPTGASDDWMQGATDTPKKIDTSNQHLEAIKSYQQTQIDVLNAIKANTAATAPGAPGRSASGSSSDW